MRWTQHDAAKTRRRVYLRAVLSGDPSSPSSSSSSSQGSKCTVVLIHKPMNQISFARLGDNGWTWLRASANCFGYHDCVFDDGNHGLLYALRWTGEAHAPVVNSICPRFQENSFDCIKYSVRAPWGDLLQVWRRFGLNDEQEPITNQVTVFKFDLAKQELVQIKDLGGHALFVRYGSSFFLSAKEFPVLTPNCVYLAHDNVDWQDGKRYYERGCNLQHTSGCFC